MRSNYRIVGDFIKQSKLKNDDGRIDRLLGVNLDKKFMPSVANLNGVDLTKYKVIKKGQFGCKLMSVGRDKKVPISRLTSYGEAIISSAYFVFEVINENELNPEYLMMWFSRLESDRFQWFQSGADIRGRITWEEFCGLPITVPSIEKQREIVKEYNNIVNCIKLKEELIQKLEETAQSIYKHWFIDFEFPNESDEPYKSSGGKMEYNDEMEKEIPQGFEYLSIQKLIDQDIIYKNQDGNHGELHPKSSDYVENGIPFIMAKDVKNGTINVESCNFISRELSKKLRIDPAITNDVLLTHKATMGRVAIVPQVAEYLTLTPQVTYYRVKNKNQINKEFLYCLFCSNSFQQELIGFSEQSTRNFLSITNQRLLKILLPNSQSLVKFEEMLSPLLTHKRNINIELDKLNELIEIVISKMSQFKKLQTEQVI